MAIKIGQQPINVPPKDIAEVISAGIQRMSNKKFAAKSLVISRKKPDGATETINPEELEFSGEVASDPVKPTKPAPVKKTPEQKEMPKPPKGFDKAAV